MAISATAGVYVPGTGADSGTKLVNEAWQRTLEDAVYEKAKLYPVAVERDRLYNKLHIRKLSTFTAGTYAQDQPSSPRDTAGIPYQANAEVEITISPTGSLVALSVSENQLAQMDVSPMANWRRSVEQAMAQSIDVNFATNFSTVTGVRGTGSGEDFSKALISSAIALLRLNAKEAWDYPQGKPAYLGVHPAQLDDLVSIPEFMNANFRGDNANPNVKGLALEALGLGIIITGNVFVDGSNVAHNPLWVPEAVGISFNTKTSVREQEFELQHRIICYANYGTAVVWDERCVDIRTNSA